MGKKGRNRRLIERRNQKIVARYYYWTEVKRLRFDDAVRQMSENEFFLSEFMIWQILKKTAPATAPEQLGRALKRNPPKVDESQLVLFKDEE